MAKANITRLEPTVRAASKSRVRVFGRARLPTRWGVFEAVAFAGERPFEEMALISGEIKPDSVVMLRMHSECLTGDALGSVKCDCRDQLELALERIAHEPPGVVLYLRQEGRGIGLAEKIRAYALQDAGRDTVDANLELGFPVDLREYDIAAEMLRALGIQRVRLLSNNPCKIEALRAAGIQVEPCPAIAPPRRENVGYLSTKRDRLGHTFDEQLSLDELLSA